VTPAPAAPPPPPDVLANLGDFWQLPALVATAAEPVAALAGDPTDPVELQLTSHAADIAPSAAYFLEAAEGQRTWSIF
jgi:hypothetical protein